MIRPPLQALKTLPALRRAGDDDAVAGLHALHLRPHRFDNAHARVIHDRRLAEVARRQRERRDRVARTGRLRSHQHVPRPDRQQRELLDVRRAGAESHVRFELPSRKVGLTRPGNLRGLRIASRAGQGCGAAGGRRHTGLKKPASRHSVAHGCSPSTGHLAGDCYRRLYSSALDPNTIYRNAAAAFL